jgi:hypothetical protein
MVEIFEVISDKCNAEKMHTRVTGYSTEQNKNNNNNIFTFVDNNMWFEHDSIL